MSNEALQCGLFLTLDAESRRQPDMAKHARKSRLGIQSSLKDKPDDGKVPSSAIFAEGKKIKSYLVNATRLVEERDIDAPPHVQAFRHLFTPGGIDGIEHNAHTVRALWATVLGGTAQFWYRLLVLSSQVLPFLLIRLVIRSTCHEDKVSICTFLVTCCSCCLDPAFSGFLRATELSSLEAWRCW